MRKIIPADVSGAAVLAVAGGTLGYAHADHDVTLAVDGATRGLSTLRGTVGDVLAEQGVTVGAHDLVAPEPSTRVSDGTRISVRYGRQLSVTVDGRPQRLWTTAATVGEALAALRLDAPGSDLSTSRSTAIGRAGLQLEVDTLKTVTVQQGTKSTRVRTTGSTIADVLVAGRIAVDADDELSRAKADRIADGSTVRVVQVSTTRSTDTDRLAYETTYRRTDELTKGDTEVDRAGRRGERTTVWSTTRKDGKITKRVKVSVTTTTEPVDKIVLVGTKEPEPEPEPEASRSDDADDSSSSSSSDDSNSSGGSSSSGGSNSASGSSVWDRLAACESGGNWAINTGNGYSGGLQFAASTWRAYGGSGQAWQASRAEQIRVAEKIRADAGYGAWPACSRKLGLL